MTAIPMDLKANLLYRQSLHQKLTRDEGLQRTYMSLCVAKPQIAFKTLLWTFQPKREQSLHKHIPFNTWPVQDECIDVLTRGIRLGGDLLVDKSREMGATWLILGCFFIDWLLVPDTTLLIISRKEEYVWQGHKGGRGGNKSTLFWKVFYMYHALPAWIKPKCPEISERHFGNIQNGATIDGESTNADVGAGGRFQAAMCDEFARVKYADAATIAETLSDTTQCRIFNSTPTSRGHPFGQIRFSGKVPVITLPWWRHPWKIRGYYESPALNTIIIHDLQFYRDKWPGIFDNITEGESFKFSEFENATLFTHSDTTNIENLSLVADGNDPANEEMFSPTGRRSPWYDRECRRRSARDKATNIDINYVGAGDVVFNPMIISRQIDTYGRDPNVRGEVLFECNDNTVKHIRFAENYGRRRLKWWSPLCGSRPDQTHNYIMGEDISMGTGQSNSTISIFDCNTHTKVGSWASSQTPIDRFAETVYAIGLWIGGQSRLPFNIWEANGPGGAFGRKLYELGYDFVFRTREEKSPTRKRKHTFGWYSTGDNKLNLLCNYDAALSMAFRPELAHKAFVNPDIDSLHEAEDYVFYPSGKAIGPSRSEADEGGAKAAHGDHVISDALCNLARWDQPSAMMNLPDMNYGSLAYRRDVASKLRERQKQESVWLI